MKIIPTAIADVLVLEPTVFGDERGYFYESFNARKFKELTGIAADFVQDNHSKSARDVLRGLHYQIQQPQGKLVRCTAGSVYDVVVDLRKSSSYGYRPVLAMVLWSPATAPNSCIKPPISGRLNMNARSCGTTRPWA